jgi:tetratricopeptide (TPR) repeat protein
MKVASTLFLGLIIFYFVACGGSNPADEGLRAFQEGDYNLAIKHFRQAQRSGLNSNMVVEKICLAYLYRGENLYNKTGNVKSFSGNFEKGLSLIPDNPSQEFKQDYSKILLALGRAYYNSKSQNEIEEQQFLDKTLSHLEQSIVQDSTNVEAAELLNQIKSDNYQKWLSKGRDYYDKARRKGNVDYFFSAEYYIKKAADFDPDNLEVEQFLTKIKKQTLSVLNYRDDVSLAIADYHRHKGKLFLDITIKNYLVEPVAVNLSNFSLVDKSGKNYSMDKKMMKEVFTDRCLKNIKLDSKKSYADGLLIFSVGQNSDIDYLAYNIDGQKMTKKYFP